MEASSRVHRTILIKRKTKFQKHYLLVSGQTRGKIDLKKQNKTKQDKKTKKQKQVCENAVARVKEVPRSSLVIGSCIKLLL